MDDIKSMDVGEEEEGGWAGHHEEVDYSKEVVFSDSSDEEGSPKKSRIGKASPTGATRERQEQEVKGSAGKFSEASSTVERAKSPDKSHVDMGGGGEERNWRRKQDRDRMDRRPDGDMMAGRHNTMYHPYPPQQQQQRPGPMPYPPHPYPPNYNRGGVFGGYPPPPPAHYPPHQYPMQHMGGGIPGGAISGGGRYPGSSAGVHRGGSLKKNYGEREDYHRGHDKDGRGPKRKWEEPRETRASVLSKERVKSPSPQHDEPEVKSETPPILDEPPPPIQRVSSLSSDNQDEKVKGHVTFAENVEELDDDGSSSQPARRGNQPKLMLRKLGDKDDVGGDSRHDGKDRPRDGKGRPADLRGLDSEDLSGSDGGKTRTAWSMKERGPIISPKTLYEPEGKRSADKFKKYHAQTQELARVGGAELQKHHGGSQEGGSRGGDAPKGRSTPDELVERAKSPTERKEKEKPMELKKKQQYQSQGEDSKSEHVSIGSVEEKQLQHGEGKKVADKERKRSVDSEKEAPSSSYSHGPPDRGGSGGDSSRHGSSRDKPHHRKEDMRRPRGGGGGGDNKRGDAPARTDNRQGEGVGRRGKELGRRDSGESGRSGGNQYSQQTHQQDKRFTEQRGREDRGSKRKETPRNRDDEGSHGDRRQSRRDENRTSAEYTSKGGEHGNRSGEHPGRGGEHSNRGGEHPGRGGDQSNRGGSEHHNRRGDHPSKEHPGRSNEHSNRGSEHSNRGSEHSNRGSEHSNRGNEYPSRGSEQSVRGGGGEHPRVVEHPKGGEHFRGGEHQTRGTGDRGYGKRTNEQDSTETGSDARLDHRRHDRDRVRGQPMPPRGRGSRQDDTRRHDRGGPRERHQQREDWSRGSSQDNRKLDSPNTAGENKLGKTHSELGYTELEDVSSSDEDVGVAKSANSGKGAKDKGERPGRDKGGHSGPKPPRKFEEKGKQRGGEARGGGKGINDRRPRTEPGRDLQQSTGPNRKGGKQRDDRRRGGERKEEERDSVQGGKGDRTHASGRDRKEQEKNGSQGRGTRQGEAKQSPSATTDDVESSQSEPHHNPIKNYDLNSYKIAIADDINTHATSEEWPVPMDNEEFVEVTSKKAQKVRQRKEKEEQKKEEEKRLEEQKKRKKKKPSSNSAHGSTVDRGASTSSKVHSTWSSVEGKSDETWSAAPGSHLKSAQQSQLQQSQNSSWVPTALPASSFSLTGGSSSIGSVVNDSGDLVRRSSGLGTSEGDAKAAVPHTAELVSSSSAIYNLFATYSSHFSPFSPSVASAASSSLLDQAVDSTIGTVSSPRTVDPHDSLPLENILADINSNSTGLTPDLSDDQPGKGIGEGLLLPPADSGVSVTMPPKPRPVGRGRGSAARGMGGERRRGKADKERPAPGDKVTIQICKCMICINTDEAQSTMFQPEMIRGVSRSKCISVFMTFS